MKPLQKIKEVRIQTEPYRNRLSAGTTLLKITYTLEDGSEHARDPSFYEQENPMSTIRLRGQDTGKLFGYYSYYEDGSLVLDGVREKGKWITTCGAAGTHMTEELLRASKGESLAFALERFIKESDERKQRAIEAAKEEE